ncbi:MAG: hypothetical protein ACRDPC_12340, partial [Solirubrobacteraceae bacterium]
VEISEREAADGASATVSGSQTAWVHALGPDGSADELTFSGNRSLAEALLSGFTTAAARRVAA